MNREIFNKIVKKFLCNYWCLVDKVIINIYSDKFFVDYYNSDDIVISDLSNLYSFFILLLRFNFFYKFLRLRGIDDFSIIFFVKNLVDYIYLFFRYILFRLFRGIRFSIFDVIIWLSTTLIDYIVEVLFEGDESISEKCNYIFGNVFKNINYRSNNYFLNNNIVGEDGWFIYFLLKIISCHCYNIKWISNKYYNIVNFLYKLRVCIVEVFDYLEKSWIGRIISYINERPFTLGLLVTIIIFLLKRLFPGSIIVYILSFINDCRECYLVLKLIMFETNFFSKLCGYTYKSL